MKVEIDIKGNKFSKEDIDNMLSDYLMIGKHFFMRNNKEVENLLDAFNKKYKNCGTSIITRKRNIKYFLNSAMYLYKFSEFCLCRRKNDYDKYVYGLHKQDKSTRVYVSYQGIKEIIICYNSLYSFLENWFILKNFGGVLNG